MIYKINTTVVILNFAHEQTHTHTHSINNNDNMDTDRSRHQPPFNDFIIELLPMCVNNNNTANLTEMIF